MKNKVKIIKMDKDMTKVVALFLTSHTSDSIGYEGWIKKMNLFWYENPFFDYSIHPMGWCVIDVSGEVRGFLANIPVKYTNKDGDFQGFWASSWYVDVDFRGHSLKLFNEFVKQKGVLFNTTPTKIVKKILLKKYKFQILGAKSKCKDYLVPLRGFNPISSQEFYMLPVQWLLKFATAMVVIFYNAIVGFALKVLLFKTDLSISDHESSDKDLYKHSEIVHWKYLNNNIQKERHIYYLHEGKSCIGYVGLKIRKYRGISYCEISEISEFQKHTIYKKIVFLFMLYKTIQSKQKTCVFLKYRVYGNIGKVPRLVNFIPIYSVSFKSNFLVKCTLDNCDNVRIIASNSDGDNALFT
jgi:hypothetical protein